MIEDIKLAPGLAIIRYKSVGSKGNAVITADIPPRSRGSLTLLTDPTAHDEALAAPGDLWVIQCRHPSVISLNIESSQPGVAARGGVVVEYLSDQSKPKRNIPKEQGMPTPRSINEGLQERRTRIPSVHETPKIMAHVANHGDIYAELGDWLRGDGRDEAIEGLSLSGSGCDRIMMRDLNSGQIAEPGEYLGSRGQFRSLGRLQMWLENSDQAQEICVEALFEEAGFREASGRSITLAGVDDQDPLIGLKIWFQMKRDSPRVASNVSRDARNESSKTERMKIFRKEPGQV